MRNNRLRCVKVEWKEATACMNVVQKAVEDNVFTKSQESRNKPQLRDDFPVEEQKTFKKTKSSPSMLTSSGLSVVVEE